MGKSMLKTTADRYEANIERLKHLEHSARTVNDNIRITFLDNPTKFIAYNKKDEIDSRITKYITETSMRRLFFKAVEQLNY